MAYIKSMGDVYNTLSVQKSDNTDDNFIRSKTCMQKISNITHGYTLRLLQ